MHEFSIHLHVQLEGVHVYFLCITNNVQIMYTLRVHPLSNV